MKNSTLIVNTTLSGMMLLFCTNVLAQPKKTTNISQTKSLEADKRMEDYLKLSRLGYTEKEIFEDLGNVSFLIEDFKTAAFWYQKLIDLSGSEAVSQSYIERYKVAMHKAGIANYGDELAQADWHSKIKEDYQVAQQSPYKKLTPTLAAKNSRPTLSAAEWSNSMEALNKLAGLSGQQSGVLNINRRLPEKGYIPPVTVSADRKTAFFSKPTYIKPEYGIFSKKDMVHKIYKAENINGQWMNVTEIGVCPKYASAIHPTISPDGQRLFFASDMPGSFGKYDIYVADIKKDGSIGIAKNLGHKVNTKKNDMYPNLVGSELLFFASNGREGEGGLDLFAVQVGTKRVGIAVNIGAPFNSKQDDYAFDIKAETGVAIVMSNRGNLNNEAQQLVFSVSDIQKNLPAKNRKNNFLELLPRDPNSVYTNIYYQD